MAKLEWDKTGERLYETGISNTALYVVGSDGRYGTGVAWDGVSAITEKPTGGDSNAVYADNIKYLDLKAIEEFEATIEAYTYPEEFSACDGSAEIAPGVYAGQQSRSRFGLAYKSLIGSDAQGTDHGYKLHIIYGASAKPSEKGYKTVNNSPEAMTMSWEMTTNPVVVPGYKPTACITIDSTKVDANKLKAVEDKLFGSDEAGTAGNPTLIMPDELITMLSTGSH